MLLEHLPHLLAVKDRDISNLVGAFSSTVTLLVLVPRVIWPRGITMLEEYPLYRVALAIMSIGLAVNVPLTICRVLGITAPAEIFHSWVLKDIGFAVLMVALWLNDFRPLVGAVPIEGNENTGDSDVRYRSTSASIPATGMSSGGSAGSSKV